MSKTIKEFVKAATKEVAKQSKSYTDKKVADLDVSLEDVDIELTNTGSKTLSIPSTSRGYATLNEVGGKSSVCSNIWDEQWEVGGINSQGGNESYSNAIRSKNFIKVLPNTTYKLVCTSATSEFYVKVTYYTLNQTFIDYFWKANQTFTTPSNCEYIKISTNNNTYIYGSKYNDDIAIIRGTTGTYEPYYEGIKFQIPQVIKSVGGNKESTLSLSALNEELDSKLAQYGGREAIAYSINDTTRNYIDLANNKAIVKVGKLNMDDLNWENRTSDNKNRYLANIPNAKHVSSSSVPNMYSSSITFTDANSGWTNAINGTAYLADGTSTLVYFGNSAPTGTLLYELATPIEIEIPDNIPETHIEVEPNGTLYFYDKDNQLVDCYANLSMPVSLKGLVELNYEHDKHQQQSINNHEERLQEVEKELDKLAYTIVSQEEVSDIIGTEVYSNSVIESDVEITRLVGKSEVCSNLIDVNSRTTTGNIDLILNDVNLASGSYILTFNTTASGVCELILKNGSNTFYDTSFGLSSKTTISFNATQTITKIQLYVSGSGTYSNIMLNKGSTALPYEPYYSGIHNSTITALESVDVNIWDEEWEKGYYNVNDGVTKVPDTSNIRFVNYVPVSPNTTYAITLNGGRVFFYDINKNLISSLGSVTNSFITPNNCYYIKMHFNASTYNHDIAIIRGTTGSYVPYQKETRNLSGVVKRVMGSVDFGSLSWTMPADGLFQTVNLIDEVNTSGKFNFLCPRYKESKSNSDYAGWINNEDDKSMGFLSTKNRIIVKDTSYTDVASFKASLSGVELIYELATPVYEQYDGVLREGDVLILDNPYLHVVPNGSLNQVTTELPAIIDYKLPFNVASQVEANSKRDVVQQKEIEELKNTTPHLYMHSYSLYTICDGYDTYIYLNFPSTNNKLCSTIDELKVQLLKLFNDCNISCTGYIDNDNIDVVQSISIVNNIIRVYYSDTVSNAQESANDMNMSKISQIF